MRNSLALTVVALLAASVLPATAQAESNVACGPDDGRERLTVDGYQAAFEAPVVTYPGLSAPVNNMVGPTTQLRSAPFPFTVDVAPAATANLRIRLEWDETSDFDFFVFDDVTGTVIGTGAEDNVANGLTFEDQTVPVAHCDRITVAVRSWAGSPLEELRLGVTVTPGSTLLACAAGDPAPGCAGKEAGEAPDATPEDRRTRLYLGGPVGQASMLWRYAETQAGQGGLPQATMEPERPTSGTPNGHTRVASGFRRDNATAWGNPFIPHWSVAFDEPATLDGDVTAVLWASSRTIDETGVFYMDLWIDGALERTVAIPGTKIGENPTRLAVTFSGLSRTQVSEVTLQAATEPVATSGGQVNNPREAEVTVHYGSVQFPSFVTLP